MNNTAFSFSGFMESTAGGIVTGVACAVLLVLIIDLNYKVFTKALLGSLLAFVLTVITSPAFLVLAVISKKRTGNVFERQDYLGKNGKIIYLHRFAGINSGISGLARLLDVLCGRLSFVGVSLLDVKDGAFIDDENMERFNARPGIVCHLVLSGYPELTYEEAFALDIKYAKRRELFKDILIILKRAVLALRGEGKNYLGETRNGYAETLLGRGEITQKDLEKSLQLADDAATRSERAEQFKKQKRG